MTLDLTSALIITILVMILFFLMAKFGLKTNTLSSLVLAMLVGLIVLNLLFPITELADQISDTSLWIYAIVQIVALAVIFVYVLSASLIYADYSEKRCYKCKGF